MAPFAKYLQSTNDPSYLGYSKEIEGPKPNLALAKLFSGLGETLDAGIKGGTDLLDIKIEDEVQRKVKAAEEGSSGTGLSLEDAAALGRLKNKAETGSLGTGAGGNVLSESTGTTNPPVVDQGLSRLDKLTQQYNSGQLSPTYFLTQQQIIAQQLKQRYPGSEKEIDTAIHRATAPANEIRRQVFADFQAAAGAANSANKDWEHYVRSKSEILGDQGTMAALQPGVFSDKTKQFQITAFIAKQEKIAYDLKQRHAETTAKLADNTLSTQDAERALTLDAQGAVSGMFQGAFSPLSDLQKSIDQAVAPGGKFDENFILATKSTATEMRRAAETHLDAMINTPNKDGKSYAAIINDPTKIAQIRKQVMEPFDRIDKAIGVGDLPLASFHADHAKRMVDMDTSKLFETSNMARWLAATKPIGDQNLVSNILTNPNNMVTIKDPKTGQNVQISAMSAFWQDILNLQTTNAASGGQVNKEGLEGMSQSRPGQGSPPPQLINEGLTRLKTMLTSPEASIELKKGVVDYVIKDTNGDFFRQLTPTAQLQAFNILTAPEMSSAIAGIGDPKKYSDYTNWAEKIFTTHTMARKGVLDGLVQDKQLKFQYNPETNLLDWDKDYVSRQNVQYPELDKTVTQINNGLRNLDTVYKQQNVKAGDKLGPLFKSMGVPITPPTTGEGKRSEATAPAQLAFSAVEQTQPEAQQAITSALNHAAGIIPGSTPEGMNAVAKLIPDKSLQGKMVSPMEIAQQFEGAHEVAHRQIISAFISDVAGRRIDPVTTAWCAAFVNAVLNEGGIKGTGSLAARSFLNFGQSVDKPQKGDIVVLSRGRDPAKGHVGFFDSMTEDGKVRILAGNQNNRVSYGEFPSSQILGIRRASAKDVKNAQL